jgi:small conductance mechanosensitive channel
MSDIVDLENLKKFWQVQAVQLAISLAKAAAILVVGWVVARTVSRLLTRTLQRLRVETTLIPFLSSLAYALVLVIVVVTVLGQLGIPTASLVAVLGAGGVAIALALQSSLGNLASGIMILSFRLFRVGDTVEVAGARGQVAEIQIFHTILTSDDGQRIVVPNAKITSEVVRHRAAAR